MTKIVTGLKLHEISFVPGPGPLGAPANKHCNIIYKREPETAWVVVEEYAKDDIRPMQPAYAKSVTVTNLKSQPENEVSMSEISKADATEAVLDALVLARQQQCPGKDEATAMTKVLATEAGRKIYGEMVYAKDLEVAKATTLRTYGNRTDTKKAASSSADTRQRPPPLIHGASLIKWPRSTAARTACHFIKVTRP